MRPRTAFFLSVFLLLAGCITVKNFGVYWGTGTLDPALAGTWNSARASGGSDVTFTAEEGNIYRMPFTITKTTFTIQELNPESMKWLTKISTEPEWWINIQKFKRAQPE